MKLNYTILPKRIYTGIGKESSETTFVTEFIRDALNLDSYRNGNFPFENNPNNNEIFLIAQEIPEQVHHFSLPFGVRELYSLNLPCPHLKYLDKLEKCNKKNESLRIAGLRKI